MVDEDSFLLIITGGISIIGGIIFGLYYTRIFLSFIFYLKKNRSKSNNSTATKEENKVKELEDVLNTKPNLIKKNSQLMEDELRIYQFEKDLATHAIENILLASKNKSIDSFEKDRLLLKYKEQLKKLNEKMEKIQSEIDVTKLIILRDDLAFLLDNKISDIDEKIKEINFKIGTNYKVKEMVNHDRINKTNDNSLKNIDNPFVDIEETVDANLSLRELTSYKNNPSHKRKEMVIESEREKIDDLKDQVLVALNRLDKIGDIKMEIDDQPDTKKVIQDNIFTFTDKDLRNNLQEKLEVNDKEHLSTQNDKKYVNNLTEKNLNIPKIFSFRDVKSENEIVTTNNGTFDPLRKIAVERSLNNEIDVNLNRINESNSFANVDINQKNQDHNKKTPLSNILNQNSSPSFNHSIEPKYNKETYLSEDESNKGKQSLNQTNNKKNIFKLPLAFIFSRITKQDENKKVEERIFETKKERRDSLSNIVNKNKNKNNNR
ncbi:MAG: hypothetical protein ACXWFB_10075, partial [Nitrososphaeraceae archaeon]